MRRAFFKGLWAGFGFAVFLLAGCAHFSSSRETCVGKVDSPQEAVDLVVPHLAAAAVCASKNVKDDEAAKACVKEEFDKLATQAKPVALACGLTLLSDAVSAAKK